jgi:hypothetical protein
MNCKLLPLRYGYDMPGTFTDECRFEKRVNLRKFDKYVTEAQTNAAHLARDGEEKA